MIALTRFNANSQEILDSSKLPSVADVHKHQGLGVAAQAVLEQLGELVVLAVGDMPLTPTRAESDLFISMASSCCCGVGNGPLLRRIGVKEGGGGGGG